MRKVSYEILKQFCADGDELRPVMNYPHKVDGYWCASDNKTILLVKEDACKKNIPMPDEKLGKYPQVFRVLDPSKVESKYQIDLDDIRSAISQCPLVEEIIDVPTDNELEKCEACGGEGEVSESVHFRGKWYDYSAECPCCHGCGKVPVDPEYDPDWDDDPEDFQSYKQEKTGKMVPDDRASIEIHGHIFRAEYLVKICSYMEAIGVEDVKVCLGEKQGRITIFEFPQSYLGVMPLIGEIDNVKAVSVPIKDL